ncbi:hypothetical protein DMC61_17575 [Amycolatopsis sp. WAC 04169]|nr:hypothetical protein DMC61_17575 [Amycolatopsis sp. WAC 04169]
MSSRAAAAFSSVVDSCTACADAAEDGVGSAACAGAAATPPANVTAMDSAAIPRTPRPARLTLDKEFSPFETNECA